jgi:DNA adenine methylase
MNHYSSPLRYPGGKARLAPYIRAVIEHNGLDDGHYAEPYAGGASVALDLIFNEFVRFIHINDFDRSVFAFWYAVLNDTDEICYRTKHCPLTVDEWRRQRSVQLSKSSVSLRELGFSTFFLNRTSRSGIVASSGVIGGNDQRGRWKIDARFNRSDLVRRIRRIAEMGDRISLTNLDAIDFLATLSGALPEKSLTYLDPPYYVMGRRRLYANYYNADDHADIAKLLEACPFRWLVSYDYTPEILELYLARRCLVYDLPYSAAARYDGAEVMFFSDDLFIPDMLGRCGPSVVVRRPGSRFTRSLLANTSSSSR